MWITSLSQAEHDARIQRLAEKTKALYPHISNVEDIIQGFICGIASKKGEPLSNKAFNTIEPLIDEICNRQIENIDDIRADKNGIKDILNRRSFDATDGFVMDDKFQESIGELAKALTQQP